MKLILIRSILVVQLLFVVGAIIAQPPTGINYQSVAKDPMGNVAKNRNIYVKSSILQSSAVGGTKVWEETFLATSDNDGVYTIIIGRGTKSPSINISDIGFVDWGNGPYFLNTKVAVAPSIPATWWVAADNYLDMGTAQMMSVPYALYAGNASVTNVTTSLPPGPPNTFLITDSLGNVNWATPQAAQTTVTTITNFNVKFNVSTGQSVTIEPNSLATVNVKIEGVEKGDPILVTPQEGYDNWTIYAAWVSDTNFVSVKFANYTDTKVDVLGSQYKIVVIK
jgi:hypothetical protein